MPEEERMASWHLVEAGTVHSAGAAFPPVFAGAPAPGLGAPVGRLRDLRVSAGWPMISGMAIDPLIDLPTADDFHALLAREELRRARTGETLTIAMLDVDGLRWVNAHHGAGAGNDVLRLCVATLRSNLRAVDELARMGPDEFAVLLHATDARKASVWADRFEDELQAVSFEMDAGPVTCSVGLADTSSGITVMEAASKAHRRMEVIQTMRKLRRTRGGDALGPA
jgi:diguanylate cyclase (GGDEF)-like protein